MFRGDDSGARAVFTEQGSSASQVTGAKVMDVIARPPDCAGHAADAVSAFTQVKMEDAPKIAQNSEARVSGHIGYLFHATNGRNRGQTLKIQWFFLNDSWRKFCWNLDGKKYRTGNVYLFIKNKDYSCPETWMTTE